jgi:hypothetical protein
MRRYILNFWRDGVLDESRAMGFASDDEALTCAQALTAGRDVEVFTDERFIARIAGGLQTAT